MSAMGFTGFPWGKYMSNENEQTPQWHAETIAAAVQDRGICVFYSELFGENIAFILDLRYKKYVPSGTAVYTNAELKELFDKDKPKLSSANLKLTHEAKKVGGFVTKHESQGGLI